jgi:hypothetical protein
VGHTVVGRDIERICGKHIHIRTLSFFYSFSSLFKLIYNSRFRMDIELVDGLDLQG